MFVGNPISRATACSRWGTTTKASYAFRGARWATWLTSSASSAFRKSSSWSRTTAALATFYAANTLIAQNSKRLGKNLRTDAGQGEPIRVYEASSDYAEAQWIMDETKQFRRDGQPLRVAVLYRSNAQSRID